MTDSKPAESGGWLSSLRRCAEARTKGFWPGFTVDSDRINLYYMSEWRDNSVQADLDAQFIAQAARTYDELLAIAEVVEKVNHDGECFGGSECWCGYSELETALARLKASSNAGGDE